MYVLYIVYMRTSDSVHYRELEAKTVLRGGQAGERGGEMGGGAHGVLKATRNLIAASLVKLQ